jgi:hypothetical protein
MEERLEHLAEALVERDGTRWTVWLLGSEAPDGLWDGALEFAGAAGVASHRTPRETRQPGRADLLYWFSGLTPVYLEGALDRARAAAR